MSEKNNQQVEVEEELVEAVEGLDHTINQLPRLYKTLFNPSRALLLTFVKGIVYGLGMICAIAVVLPILIWFLRYVEWIPLLGDFFSEIAQRMQETSTFNR